MLTKRQNLLETIHGGAPDRFVNQYSAFALMKSGPVAAKYPRPKKGESSKDGWGVTYSYPESTCAAYPIHGDGLTVLENVTKWRGIVKGPELDYSEAEWAPYVEEAERVDRNEQLAAVIVPSGTFEQLHHLMDMENCLISFCTEPEAMHELIDYITEWRIGLVSGICSHLRPDALILHDDWGSQSSTFLSPDMFAEFIAPSAKKVYNACREMGVSLIVHHCDSYAATLVPQMIDMGVDIWQGCMTGNNIPELVKKYGGQISFMGDLDNGVLDRADTMPEIIAREVRRACTANGKHYFIPCLTMGAPNSVYPGIYDAVSAEIDRISAELFR